MTYKTPLYPNGYKVLAPNLVRDVSTNLAFYNSMIEESQIDATNGVGSVIYSGGQIEKGTGLTVNVLGGGGAGTLIIARGPNLTTAQLPVPTGDTPSENYYKTWVNVLGQNAIAVPDNASSHIIIRVDCVYNDVSHTWEIGGGKTDIVAVNDLPAPFQDTFPFCYIQLGIVQTSGGEVVDINQEIGNYLGNPTPGGAGVPFAQVRSFDFQKSAGNLPIDGPVGIYRTGMVMFFATPASYIDFLRINGTGIDWIDYTNGISIGSPASGATGAYDKAKALYIQQWQARDNSDFTISGGRGSSAEEDWAANKKGTFNNAPTLAGCTTIIKL